ncbi:amino acid permease [Tolypothrix sp. FACHB-123]|uniref:ATP-binding protein n=1 Tax=Tolypothrix sp. FACHB-123 TaxID=2692868 RepID=UPI0016836858|nr:ATP-binding protein [Tolypothrix sp. FACHB-123]MBD2356833.1 amino acid permease [Tolypothrix sp. FACHB-123]
MSNCDRDPVNPSLHGNLTRSLSSVETWGFGLTGHILWIAVIPAIHAALGSQAIFVWIPAVLCGMLLNYQMQHLGFHLQNIAGGTPNYASHLLKRYPGLARYAALGYYFSWVSVLPVNAIVLTDLIEVNLAALGISCPKLLLEIGLTLLPFVLAFSGTRALSILHLFFVIPAFGLLLIFSAQGLGWLAFSSASPGFFPEDLSLISFGDWAKWFLYVTYATYACETAASFVADSRHPHKTLFSLKVAAWLMLPIYLGASWVVMRLATDANLKDSAFLNLLAAAKPFWGDGSALIITFLLSASCLLACATVVSNCSRILYQLSRDHYIASVFAVVSRRGVFGPALALTLVLSLGCLIWGNVAAIVVVGNVGWFISIMAVHLGIWLQRDKPQVLFPRITLGILLVEVAILFVGGLAWGWREFIMGLLLPLGIISIDAIVNSVAFPPFRPLWWMKYERSRPAIIIKDSVMLQVSILIFLLCSTVTIGWVFGFQLNQTTNREGENLFVVLLMTIAFVGVAIACWTSLPQVVAIAEAREAAEHLFTIAQDAILVTDEQGIINQANPATELLFNINPSDLLGKHLNKLLPELAANPQQWAKRSEQIFTHNTKSKILEIAISDRPHQYFQEYIVILHDITKRKQAEEILRNSEAELKAEAQQLASQLVQSEKMSSLGQLVAGVAHEINNPVNFISGNLTPANEYLRDLLKLLELYQQHYPQPVPEIKIHAKQIDIDFIISDLPRLLNSMKVGADRITEIVLSLRNFSRLDESDMKVVNIHEGIDSTLMILAHRFKANDKRPEIKVVKEYHDLPFIECYPGQLNQVLMNILANAIDALEDAFFTQPKPQNLRINITTLLTKYQNILIKISDNGCGIPEIIQQRLFEPFFTTKPIGKGTGLGLSISYKIITEKHHGTLKCNSVMGKGTEFTIEIPIHQK